MTRFRTIRVPAPRDCTSSGKEKAQWQKTFQSVTDNQQQVLAAAQAGQISGDEWDTWYEVALQRMNASGNISAAAQLFPTILARAATIKAGAQASLGSPYNGGDGAGAVLFGLLGYQGQAAPYYSHSGVLVGYWDPDKGTVTRTAIVSDDPSAPLGKAVRKYSEVVEYDDEGPMRGEADWQRFFGMKFVAPDPEKQPVSYQIISFFIPPETLAQQGGVLSDIAIAAELATTITGMVDPTPMSDLVAATAQVARGANGEAAASIASIAIPFGADKLARSSSRVPVGAVTHATEGIAQSTEKAAIKMGKVSQEAGVVEGKAAILASKGPCPGPSNCFVAGTPVITRQDELPVLLPPGSDSENSRQLFIASAGAYGLSLLLSTEEPRPVTAAERRRRAVKKLLRSRTFEKS